MRRLVLALVLLATSCTDGPRTWHTLRVHGFTRPQLTGYRWFTCGRDDSYCTGFEAIAPGGERVTGAVGCGLWGKGCTLRLD